MQRNSVRDRQKVWWVTIEEIHEGIDNIIKYGKPEMLKQTVSATSGTPEEIAAGIVPNYDDMLLIINLKVSLSIQLREWGYLLM